MTEIKEVKKKKGCQFDISYIFLNPDFWLGSWGLFRTSGKGIGLMQPPSREGRAVMGTNAWNGNDIPREV